MLLPIVERELRVGGRQAASYRIRFWTVAATIVVGWLLYFFSSKGTPAHKLAQMLFVAYGVLALGFTMLSGLFLTADCLSVEKREQTMGLLFLTDLKGYDVVLGKLATTSLQGVYALLGLFPVMTVPLLMGGITGWEVARLALVLLATMFFSLSAGMLVSAFSRESRQATLGTLALLVFICGILPLLWEIGRIFLHLENFWNVLLLPSPVVTFISSLDKFYRPGFVWKNGCIEYWASVAMIWALGLGFLIWACVLSRRVWQEGTSGAESKWERLMRECRYGKPRWREKLRQALAINPIYWLARRDQFMARICMLVLAALFWVWFLFFIAMGAEWVGKNLKEDAFLILIIVTFSMHFIFKCMYALEASRRVCDDVQSGALELLACTPVSDEQFLNGFRCGLNDQFLMGKLWLVLVNIGMALLIQIHDPGELRDDKGIFVWIMLAGAGLLLSDSAALLWVSLRLALRGQRHHRVVLGAFGRVMLAPWAAIFLFFVVMPNSGISDETAKTLVWVWFIVSSLIDLQGWAAWNDLRGGFRRLLAEGETKAGPAESAAVEPEFSIASAKNALPLQP